VNPSSNATTGYGRLDRDLIIEASLRLAARGSDTEISFRDLGTELGADPTAVYRHFRNKSALMAALIERLLDDVAATLPAADDPATFLVAGAEKLFDVFLRHPAIGAHLADARVVGPSELVLAERILRSLEVGGLSGQALIDHYAIYSGFVLPYIANACRVRVATGRARVDDVAWIAESAEVTESSHPLLTRYSTQVQEMDFASTYRAGVAVVVSSVLRAATMEQ
jgi:AcrR family transcriptional regulator